MRARPSFGELDRGDAGGRKCLRSVAFDTVVIAHPALAHHRESAVGERREVARAAERTVLPDDRRHAGVEQVDVPLGDDGPHAGAPCREGLQAQQHRRAHDFALDLGPGTRRVTAHERALQVAASLRHDVRRREGAETGGDAVVGAIVVGEGFDDRPARCHPLDGVGAEFDRFAMPGDCDDVGDGEGRRPEQNGHGPSEARSARRFDPFFTSSV
jgi:hypothetical protein